MPLQHYSLKFVLQIFVQLLHKADDVSLSVIDRSVQFYWPRWSTLFWTRQGTTIWYVFVVKYSNIWVWVIAITGSTMATSALPSAPKNSCWGVQLISLVKHIANVATRTQTSISAKPCNGPYLNINLLRASPGTRHYSWEVGNMSLSFSLKVAGRW